MPDSMIQIETYDEKTVSLMLGGISLRARDLTPFFEKTASRIVSSSVRGNFLAGGRPPWKELSLATQKQRKRLGFGAAAPILRRTGKLMASASKKGDPDRVVEIKKDEMHIYSKLKVGKYFLAEIHQRGMGNNPARPMWLLQDVEVRKMITGIRRHIIEGGGYELGFRS